MKTGIFFVCCMVMLYVNALHVLAQDSFLFGKYGELIYGESLYYESAFSHDDKYIAGVNTTGISIWNAETFELVEHLYQDGGFHFLKWHPSKNLIIASNTENSNNVLYNFDQREIVSTFNANIKLPFYGIAIDHPNIVNFSKYNPLICCITANNTLILYDYLNKNILYNQSVTEQELYSVGFFESGNIWAGTKQGSVIEINIITFLTTPIFNGELTVIEVLENGEYVINYSDFPIDFGGFIRSYWLQNILNPDDRNFICRSQKDRDLPTPSRFKFNQDQSMAIVMQYTGHTFPMIIQYDINTKKEDTIGIVNEPVISTMPLNSDHSKIFIKDKRMSSIEYVKLDNEEKIKIAPQLTTSLFSFTVTEPNNFMYSYITSNSKNDTLQRKTNFWNLNNNDIERSVDDELIIVDPGVFSNDGQLFGTFFNMWNTETWEHLYEFNLEWDGLTNQVQFSPNNEYFALAKKNLWVLKTETGEVLQKFEGHEYGTTSIDFSINNNRLLSVGGDGLVILRNIESGESEIIFEDKSFKFLQYVKYINDGTQILYVTDNGLTRILDENTKEIIRTIESQFEEHSHKSTALSLNEKYLFVGNQIWDVESGKILAEYGKDLLRFESIKVSPDNNWFATKHEDNTVRVWKLDKVLQQDSSVKQFNNY